MVFVPGTAPLDRVRVHVTEKKPRFWEAQLLQILEPSPFRRIAPCAVSNRCGGCSWQHVKYPAQVEQKQKILMDSLRRLKDFEWLPFIEAPKEFHYRNRVQVHVKNGRFGFYAKGTRDLVEFKECWIAEEPINQHLKSLDTRGITSGSRLELALTEEQGDHKVHVFSAGRDPELALFSQVNRDQNTALKKRVVELVHIEPKWILDLYSGSGNLTRPLAAAFPDVPVFAVELSRSSIQRAERNPVPNVQWQVGDVASVLTKMEVRGGEGLIVLDPPRTGCEKAVMDQVLRHAPQQVIYVSCNPTTFARDAERLTQTGGFKLEVVQGLDMFPQTEHVELIASLRAAT